MEVCGIQFAPLNVPMKRRLQTLAAAAWFTTMVFGGFAGLLFALYLVIFTKLWWLTLIYLAWMWGPDKNKCERGSRRIQWVRNWAWWTYLRDYFPVNFERAPWVELDPKRNYLFCCFPHGMLSTGVFSSFATNAGGFQELFPHHTPYALTLTQHFQMPFYRELSYSLGACSASAKAIEYLLGRPDGGNVAALVVGGAAESYNCRPGEYKILLNNRKGFVKIALKHGSPLVPVISFGETDLYKQIDSPKGSLLRNLQEGLRKYIGFAPAIPIGRGFFQYSFGIVPQRRPVNTVVGKPLDVQKNPQPTQEEVDKLHAQFTQHLIAFFEEQKVNYLKNSENIHLIIE